MITARKLSLLILLCVGFLKINAQTTAIDSAEKKLEEYFNLSLSDSARNDLRAKIDHMNKFIAQDTTRADAYLQRGVYYSLLGLYVKAIADYDKAISMNNSLPIAYFNRGLAKARFRYTYDACYDLKKSHVLGLDQALSIYNNQCRMYKTSIDEKFAVTK